MVKLCPGGAQSWWTSFWWSSVLVEPSLGGAQSWWSSALVEFGLVDLNSRRCRVRVAKLSRVACLLVFPRPLDAWDRVHAAALLSIWCWRTTRACQNYLRQFGGRNDRQNVGRTLNAC